MSDMWEGELATGNHYALVFRNEGGKYLVTVHTVTSNFKTGRTTRQVTTDGYREESKELPLSRNGAEQFVQTYIPDLHAKTRELIVERLCASIDSTNLDTARLRWS